MKLLICVPSRRAICSAFCATSFSLAMYGKVYFSHLFREQAAANQWSGRSFVYASRASRSSLGHVQRVLEIGPAARLLLARFHQRLKAFGSVTLANSSTVAVPRTSSTLK